jgi:hypothetical protein
MNLREDMGSQGQDLKAEVFEHATGMLTAQPRR